MSSLTADPHNWQIGYVSAVMSVFVFAEFRMEFWWFRIVRILTNIRYSVVRPLQGTLSKVGALASLELQTLIPESDLQSRHFESCSFLWQISALSPLPKKVRKCWKYVHHEYSSNIHSTFLKLIFPWFDILCRELQRLLQAREKWAPILKELFKRRNATFIQRTKVAFASKKSWQSKLHYPGPIIYKYFLRFFLYCSFGFFYCGFGFLFCGFDACAFLTHETGRIASFSEFEQFQFCNRNRLCSLGDRHVVESWSCATHFSFQKQMDAFWELIQHQFFIQKMQLFNCAIWSKKACCSTQKTRKRTVRENGTLCRQTRDLAVCCGRFFADTHWQAHTCTKLAKSQIIFARQELLQDEFYFQSS